MEIIAVILIAVVIYGIQAIVYRKRAFKKLEYECSFSKEEAYEGERIELNEALSNYKSLPVPWVKTEITTSHWLDFAGENSEVTRDARYVPSFFYAKPHTKMKRSWNVLCKKRGCYTVNKITVLASDLFGGNCGCMSLDVDAKLLVLPGVVDLSGMFISSRYLQGDHVVRRQLVTDPFRISGVREYSPTDPMKNIHWLSSAKTGRLMVKNEEYTTRQNLNVVLNMQSGPKENGKVLDDVKVENAIRVAATLLENSLDTTIPVRFMANYVEEDGEFVDSGENWGQGFVLDQFRRMAKFELKSDVDFKTYLDTFGSAMNSTDIAIVTSYLDDFIYDFARRKAAEDVAVTIYMVSVPNEDIPSDIEVYLPIQRGGGKK
ncbi:MAG: DUF58 domain-containing protein [Oscillospiraceae bacterium]|nr:DUF58 domain-containing protein [Oscillospiraceae bacterium]MBQ9939204.1 DUF58 domain-containing protein [Oscillospiraceae bacterium]